MENDELKKYLIRSSLKNFISQLDSPHILRCNRSTVINSKHLYTAKKKGNKLVIQLNHFPEEITVSNSRKTEIQSKLNLQ